MKQVIKSLVIFFMMLEFCHTQEPQIGKCVDGYELKFYFGNITNRRNQIYARQVCREHGNSRLVKVDNPNITRTIDSVIRIDHTVFYIDGKADCGRRWTWSDGSKIYLPGEIGGYQNWYDGQPNNYGGREDCIIVGRGTKRWKDNRCIEVLGYICQKDANPCITVDSSISNTHNCIATGSSAPYVEWRRDNVPITINSNHTVYQTKSPTMAILSFENATIGDRGEYVCAARVGDKEKMSEQKTIKVNGTPSITNIKSFSCNSSLLVSWKPNHRAIGFPHRITAIATNKSAVVSSIVTPNDKVEYFHEINGLESNNEYYVQISACLNDMECLEPNDTTLRTATTNGNFKPVTDARLTQQQHNTCTVYWDWRYTDVVTQFTITLYSYSNGTLKNKDVRLVNAAHEKQYAYSFEPMQGHSYEVKVQTLKSMAFCDAVQAKGICIGKDASITDNPNALDEVSGTDLSKIIFPALGVLLLLIIAVLVAVLIKKRRNNSAGENVHTTNAVTNEVISNPPASADDNKTYLEMRPLQQSHEYATVNNKEGIYLEPLNNTYSNIT